jgi:hypothetical protein
VEVATAGIGAVPTAPDPPELPPLDGLSVASRLLFSSLPLDATPPSRASVAAARTEPRLLLSADLIASAGGSSLDLRFARRPRREFGGDFGGGPGGDPGIARFTGPAVRPLPLLRQANAAL